jgi:hypothetical protein
MSLKLPVKTENLKKAVLFQQNLPCNLLKNVESNVIRRSSLIIIILTLNYLIGIYGNYGLDPYINNNASLYSLVDVKLQNITVYFKYTKLYIHVQENCYQHTFSHNMESK